jgi:hypothetical protein
MHEELAQLRLECGDSIAVQEIDVWRDEEAGRRFGVGFLARDDIKARFARRGFECRR